MIIDFAINNNNFIKSLKNNQIEDVKRSINFINVIKRIYFNLIM